MKKILLSVITLLFLSACQKDIKIQVNLPDKPQQNKNIPVSLNNLNHSDIDKIIVSADGQKLTELPYADKFNIKLENSFKLGQHQLSFDFQKDGESLKNFSKNIELYAGVKPKVYTYELINTFPHDIDAFTQGLEFYKDTLYEGTGLHGESSLRKTDYKTGKIYKKLIWTNVISVKVSVF